MRRAPRTTLAESLRSLAATRSSSPEDIWVEEPAPLDVFIKDKKFLGLSVISPVQRDAIQHIERVYFDDAYALLAGLDPYWTEPVQQANFISIESGKGCVVEGQEIYDAATGRWEKVESWAGGLVQAIDTVNDDGSTHHDPETKIRLAFADSGPARTDGRPFQRGRGRCVRVTTASGGSLDVYEGHLFASWKTKDLPYKHRYFHAQPVWRRAGDLHPGDRIAVINWLDCVSPVPQDSREIELVGYWIGDGCMPSDGQGTWGFSVDSGEAGRELCKRYVELVSSYDGVQVTHQVMRSGAYYIRASTGRQWRTMGTPLVDIIRKYGLWGKRAWNKRVPQEFFSLPDDQLALFLSALWDTDGSIYSRPRGNAQFEYVTVSEGLARDIQRLLYRFGVVSRLTSSTKSYVYNGERRQGRRAWRVTVSQDQYIKRLASVLRLHGEKERRRVAALRFECRAAQQVLEEDIYWDRVVSVEEIGDHPYWDMTVPLAGSYAAGTIPLLSSNSGKDFICRIGALRVVHLLLCLRFPQEYYSMPTTETIHLLNVASSSIQAQRVYFKPLTRMVAKGWFEDKCEPLQTSIVFDKNIEAISGHSDAEHQEGYNLIMGAADEVDAFKSAEELRWKSTEREPVASVEAIIKMLRSSGMSRFPKVFKNVYLSYTRYAGSAIQQLTAKGKRKMAEEGDKSRYYAIGPYATWEVNPLRTREEFAEEYADDPEVAKAKYECQPGRASASLIYIKNEAALLAAFRETPEPPLAVTYELDAKGVWSLRHHISPSLKPIQGAVYAVHGDLALNNDRAGVAMAHVVSREETLVESEDAEGATVVVRELKPHIKVDFVVGLEADMLQSPPREIQIRWARQLVLELKRRGFAIGSCTFDNFQSADGMQILRNLGIPSEAFSVDKTEAPWRAVRDCLYEGRLDLPADKLLQHELMNLIRTPKGKVDHPPAGSKDLADAVAGAVNGALKLGGEEDPEGRQAFPGQETSTTGGHVDPPMWAPPSHLQELSRGFSVG